MKKFDILPFELRKLGLSEREAKTYLASLDLTQASVNKIAEKIKLNRSTTYRILTSLLKKELVIKTKRGNCYYFSANSPEKLLGMLKIKRREAEEQEREFLRIISELQNRYSSSSGKINIHTGEKGIELLLEKLSTTPSNKIFILYFSNKKILYKKITKSCQKIKKRLVSISVKELTYATNPPKKCYEFVKRKQIVSKLRKKTDFVMIISDKIMLISDTKKGICISQKDTVVFIKLLFNILWKQL